MLYNAVEVQVIKLAVCNIESRGLVSKDVLIESIIWLRERYELSSDIRYLDKAICHIYAYLELGYPYELGKSEFQKILNYLELDKKAVFSPGKWIYKKVPLGKTNIRNMLGRWNPGLHSMKINDAVNDIIEKVKRHEEGEYLYHSGKIVKQEGEEILWDQTFKLYIRLEEAVFHDVNRNKYYVIEERKSK